MLALALALALVLLLLLEIRATWRNFRYLIFGNCVDSDSDGQEQLACISGILIFLIFLLLCFISIVSQFIFHFLWLFLLFEFSVEVHKNRWKIINIHIFDWGEGGSSLVLFSIQYFKYSQNKSTHIFGAFSVFSSDLPCTIPSFCSFGEVLKRTKIQI